MRGKKFGRIKQSLTTSKFVNHTPICAGTILSSYQWKVGKESETEKMIEYLGMQFQLILRIGGQYYARIYTPSITLALFFTDDYDSEEQAIASAKAIIQDHRAMTGEV